MKQIFTLLLVCTIFSKGQAQICPSSDQNSYLKLDFIQWTSYNVYAGYYVSLTNYTDSYLDVEITLTGIVDTIVTISPYSYEVYQLGYQFPWIEGMKIKAHVNQANYRFNLYVKTRSLL
ncbi:MAG: hypothetical protein M3O67_05385 [Bacteroidota bacterium]|nr:hypothetical protein [Bacteroidota bacterium]